MQFQISKSILGSKKNIIVNSNNITISNHTDHNLWTIDNEESCKSLSLVSKINNRKIPTIYNEKQKKPFEILGIKNPNWILSLGKDNFKRFINELRDYVDAEDTFINSNVYYSDTFIKGRETLFMLSDYHICMETLAYHRKTSDVRNIKLLQSFANCKKVQYSQSSSVTGRLSIKSGPNILHLKREHRNVLKSRYGSNGAILQIDFKSLEPRILALIQKDNVPNDIYSDIVTFIGKNIDRELVKKATLATIYGMSRYNLATMLKVNDTKEIVEKINEYFGITQLQKSLIIDLAKNKKIQNFYGRNIFVEQGNEHLLVNYFTQSTGVDVSLIGFNKIINEIRNRKLNVNPIFILHDALVIDVHKDSLKQLKNLTNECIIIEGFKENKFPIELSLFYKRVRNNAANT